MDELLTLDACTLPTPDRAVRLAEFDDVFRRHVTAVQREGRAAQPRLVRLTSRHVVEHAEFLNWTRSLRSRIAWRSGRDGSDLDILATELGQLDWQTREHVRHARLLLESWFVHEADAHRIAPAT